MPLYDFKCDDCNIEFEAFGGRNIKSAMCPKCNKLTSHKLISAPGKVENFEDYLEEDITGKPIHIKHKQDLRDAIARYNDSELAAKTGKLAIYDGIRPNKVKYDLGE